MLAGGLLAAGPIPASAATRCTGVSIRGDVNGDNRAELAVTEIGRGHPSGAVHIFYGTNSGVVTDTTGTARDDQFIDQATPLVPGTNEPGDEFGAATAWGDFDSDGCADLAVGVPGENGGDGAITILYGSQQGLAATSAQWLSYGVLFGGPGDQAERFGSALVVGDFNHDGVEDLAVGAPDLTVAGKGIAGGVAVIYGEEEAGLNGGPRPDLLTRSTDGVPGNPASHERFGARLAAGDFNRNGVDQLAIVSPSSVIANRSGVGAGRRARHRGVRRSATSPDRPTGDAGAGPEQARGRIRRERGRRRLQQRRLRRPGGRCARTWLPGVRRGVRLRRGRDDLRLR